MPTFAPGTHELPNVKEQGPIGKVVCSSATVPEPGELALTSAGMLMLLGLARKKLAA
jgi:hypothetical protein